jgi:hypothetical protein
MRQLVRIVIASRIKIPVVSFRIVRSFREDPLDLPDQPIEGRRRGLILDDRVVDARLDMRDHAHLEGGRVAGDCPGQVPQVEFGSGDPYRGPDIDCGPLLT